MTRGDKHKKNDMVRGHIVFPFAALAMEETNGFPDSPGQRTQRILLPDTVQRIFLDLLPPDGKFIFMVLSLCMYAPRVDLRSWCCRGAWQAECRVLK